MAGGSRRRKLTIEDLGVRKPAKGFVTRVCKQCKDRGEHVVMESNENTGDTIPVLKTCTKCRRGLNLDARRRRPSDEDEPDPQETFLEPLGGED
jgi:hypothetical protein